MTGHLQTNIYQLPVNTSHCVGQQTVIRATERKEFWSFCETSIKGSKGRLQRNKTELGVEEPTEVTLHCINIHALGRS